MSGFFGKFYPTFLLIGCITLLSVANFSSLEIKPTVPNMDKLVHGVMYFGLSLVLLEDLISPEKPRRRYPRYMLIAFLIAVSIGGLMELIQNYLVSSRSGDWYDMLANTIGAFAGVWTGYWILPFFAPLLRILKRGK